MNSELPPALRFYKAGQFLWFDMSAVSAFVCLVSCIGLYYKMSSFPIFVPKESLSVQRCTQAHYCVFLAFEYFFCSIATFFISIFHHFVLHRWSSEHTFPTPLDIFHIDLFA